MGKKDLKRQAAEAAAAYTESDAVAERPSKKPRVDSRSLFVRGLASHTTTETLTDFFSQHFPVKHATVVVDRQTKSSRGFGFVTFTDVEDTQAAKEQLQGHKVDGRPISLDVAESRHRQPGAAAEDAAAKKEDRRTALAEARKAPKLIIRNLPWSIKHSDQLATLFRSYGLVKYADIPQSKGKLSGFGFVTMRGRKNAQAAMEGVNGKVVHGRTVSVDWAVSKDEWQKHETNDSKSSKYQEQSDEDEDEDENEGDVDKGDEEDDKESGEKEDEDDEEEDEDIKNFMKNHMGNLEDEDSDAEEDDDEGGSDGDDAASDSAPVPSTKPLMTDNKTTLFIRNLPFLTTDDQLKTHFEQFGHIRYARVVHDKATDRPAGTGFVCFAQEDEFKACLKGAPRPQQSAMPSKRSILQNETAVGAGKYTIDGRVLQVSQAVNKDEASRLAESGATARGDGKQQDKRRIYLLSEGVISKDSPMFNVLPPAEVKIRDQSIAQRKKLIQSNPSLHLSLTRLAVRNIPREIDSKALKALAREAVVGFATDVKAGLRQPLSKEENARGGEEDKEAERRRKEKGKGIVKQTKIMFENKEGSKVGEADGAGKSRGYGFIEYTSHRWALMGLRWLNGHALKTGNGKTLRLIVEFAIENAQVVARRKDLQAKTKAHLADGGKGQSGQGEGRYGQNGQGDARFNRNGQGESRFGRNSQGEGGHSQRPPPRGKDFSVSKGKWQGQNGKDTGRGRGRGQPEDPVKAAAQGATAKEDLKQKIIARKRMTRKKKAGARS
ncbi:putative RNA recognition motif containing protein [Rosellinia necatrix]|uniref:Putative RNA recognition motif containing protein n=1 Tax=Rosellinia necatrix TaxID=77044 RepID=A0A1W2TWL3_ROSNE|nr:putative RNA recognition motif containing protein [Rosellinia necatrix]